MPACTPMVDRFETLTDLRSFMHLTYTLPEVLFIVYASILSGYRRLGGNGQLRASSSALVSPVLSLPMGDAVVLHD